MGNTANTEARIKRLENLIKDETGAGLGTAQSGTIRYPVRQLTITEEASRDDLGAPVSTVLVRWKSPAGSAVPDKIRLAINGETVELDGRETSYRKGGYAAGDAVKVAAAAVYSFGSSSAVTASLTLTGEGAAPATPLTFKATGGFKTITLEWKIPDDPNFSHIEVWESLAYDNLETAERVAQAYGSDFVRSNCGVLETRWYWIRAVDTGGNKGEFAGPKSATTQAVSMEDIPDGTIGGSKLLPSLSQKIESMDGSFAAIPIPAILNALSLDQTMEQGATAERALNTKVDEGLAAEATERLKLTARVDDAMAAVTEESTARVEGDNALSERITTIGAQTEQNIAAIQQKMSADAQSGVAITLNALSQDKELESQAIAERTLTIKHNEEVSARELLAIKQGEAQAQIEQVSKVTAGKPDVYNQPSAPSGSLKLGDLWIDGDGLIHRWTGAAWEECRDKELVELMELATAQAWLKAQVSAGGKTVLAGIGLLADTTTGSEITMLADRFYLVSDVDGEQVQPFAVDGSKVLINGNLFVQALKDGGYADSSGWIVGEKIAANSRIQVGESIILDGPNNLIQIGDNIIIDGGSGAFF